MSAKINYKKIAAQIYENLKKEAVLKDIGMSFLTQSLGRFLFRPAVEKENILSSIVRLPEKLKNKIYDFASKSEGHSLLASALFGHHYYGSYMPKALINFYNKTQQNILLGTISNMGRSLYNLATAVDENINKATNMVAHYVAQYTIDRNVKNSKVKQFLAGLLETYGSPRIEQVKQIISPFMGIVSLPIVVKKLQNMKDIKEEQIADFVMKMHQSQQEPYDLIDKVNLISYQQQLSQGNAPKRRKE